MPPSDTIATADAVISPKAMAALRIGAAMETVRSRSSTIFKGAQDAFGRVRLLEHLGAERREGIVDRVADRRAGADGAGLADALGAERGARDRRLDVRDDDVRHLARPRHQETGHRAVEEL